MSLSLHTKNKLYKRRALKCTCGVVSVVVLLMASSIWAVWTSKVSNWRSNLSMRAEIWSRQKEFKPFFNREEFVTNYNYNWIVFAKVDNVDTIILSVIYLTFSRFIDLRAESMLFTTPAIEFVTWEKKTFSLKWQQTSFLKSENSTDF